MRRILLVSFTAALAAAASASSLSAQGHSLACRRSGHCGIPESEWPIYGKNIGLNIVNKTSYPLSIGGSYHWTGGTKGNPQQHNSDFEYGPVNPGDSLFVILASSDQTVPYVTATTTFTYAPDERWLEVLGVSRPPKQCAKNAYRYEVSPGSNVVVATYTGPVLAPPDNKITIGRLLGIPEGGSYIGGQKVVNGTVQTYANQGTVTFFDCM